MFETLVLSASLEPLRSVKWSRALKYVVRGRAEVLEEYDNWAPLLTVRIRIPAVIKLLRHFTKKRAIKFSRTNIYQRDKYKCQYCGCKVQTRELTYDHVMPRSRGGKTEWNNIVTCCQRCNLKKADKTPGEAGMRLLSVPVRPSYLPLVLVFQVKKGDGIPEVWRSYLYWNTELENDN